MTHGLKAWEELKEKWPLSEARSQPQDTRGRTRGDFLDDDEVDADADGDNAGDDDVDADGDNAGDDDVDGDDKADDGSGVQFCHFLVASAVSKTLN